MIKYLNKTTEKIYFGFIAFKLIAKQSTMLKGMGEGTSYGRWHVENKDQVQIHPSQWHNFWKTLPSK